MSGVFGYKMGHEALKGVTQPDVSPSKKLTQANGGNEKSDPHPNAQSASLILDEQSLIQDAEAIMKGTRPAPKPSPKPEPKVDAEAKLPSPDDEEKEEAEPQAQLVNHSADFNPIKSDDRGVTLAITNAAQEEDNYLLDISLKNEGVQDVQFLYSFLDIRDEQGRSVSGVTDGLPGELPATGEWFSGTIRIPTTLIEETDQLSLSLTDYPDQQLELNLSDIPVVR